MVDQNHSRLPTPADAIQLHPCPVGRKIIVEIVYIGRRRAGVSWRRFLLGRRQRFLGGHRRHSIWDWRSLIPQSRIVIQHRCYHRRRQPEIPQIKHIIRAEVERRLRILDIGQNDIVSDA